MKLGSYPIVIKAIILSGGQGQRLNKQDKGLLKLAGRPLVAHVIETLSSQVDSIFISANRNIAEYQAYGYKVVEDKFDEFEGPLAGIYRGMLEMKASLPSNSLILVVPCDAPFLPHDLVNRLLSTFKAKNCQAVLAHDGIRRQPLFGLYSIKLLPDLEHYLKTGNRKVGEWVSQVHAEIVDFSDETEDFLNINSPEDLAEAEKRFTYNPD